MSRSLSEPLTILLIEDNPGDVRLIREGFNEIDLEVAFQVATDGEEALAILAAAREDEATPYPDLVLLDLNLPRIDGFDVLEELRADQTLALIPVLILSSSHSTQDISRSYELCANAYLTKPSDPDGFVSIARSVESFWLESVELPPIPA